MFIARLPGLDVPEGGYAAYHPRQLAQNYATQKYVKSAP